jgi:phenylalanyl-tRNA synthetase alpha chain
MHASTTDLLNEIEQFSFHQPTDLDVFKNLFLGKKGKIAVLFEKLKDLPVEERKAFGAEVNKLKDLAQQKWTDFQQQTELLLDQDDQQKDFDFTLPDVPGRSGSRHPISLVKREIVQVFERLGFNLALGPEIEDDWHNFTALNFPADHPAREMQDTFFISRSPDIALRTHTSSVQIRTMERLKPPIRSIAPGRVFRNEAISARAHCLFHQVEGFYIDRGVSFKDLKDTLYHFCKELFFKEIEIRFRPSFFPFTEPSAEMDITCLLCKGKGCNVCKQSGWVEIGGAGMIHPEVMRNCGIDPDEFSGFAFGMGIERITMLKYQIKDLRLFTENDVRFLNQFQAVT